ncbi:MAG TPA: sodium-dependent transporter [Longimicrobiales bacterium]|nr:sodium-dependent transporter [Longimicrobiales bacterium]
MNDPSTSTAGGPVPPEATGAGRELWGSRFGFLMAAVGSAVGLGNMWRFSYATAEHGGAAFVMLYLIITFTVGVPVMIAEFGIGRETRRSPIGALRRMGGAGWVPAAYLFVAAGFLILSYYAVIAGWVSRYAIEAILSPWPADAGAYFGAVSGSADGASKLPPILYHLGFMALTILIVAGGVKGGIERVSSFMMPLLGLILVGLAVWATTLAGAGEGYRYYLTPKFEELFSLETLAAASSQAFFSLSLGMGAMLTFASYLKRDTNLPAEATIISLSDLAVAFIAGLVVFPVIFALGLQEAVGESTVGALFISLPGAFVAMGAIGRVVGIFFFVALFIGAITSAIALLEVVVSSVIDEWKFDRRKAAIAAGIVIALLGILPASNINALDAMDGVASEVFLPLGGLLLAMLVGWGPAGKRLEVFSEGASPAVRGIFGGWLWTLRVVVPILLVVVLSQTVPSALEKVRTAFGG